MEVVTKIEVNVGYLPDQPTETQSLKTSGRRRRRKRVVTCCPRTQSPRVLSLLQHAALSHLHYQPDNCLQPVMSASCPSKHALYNFPFLPLSLWFSRENMSVFSLFVFLLTDEREMRERESNIGVWAGWGWPPGKQGWITGPVTIKVDTWQNG